MHAYTVRLLTYKVNRSDASLHTCMQSQMAGLEEMRNPRRAVDGELQLAWIERRRRGLEQQLLDSGRACMLLAALVLTWEWDLQLTRASSSPEHVLLAGFVLWLFGVALVMLSLVSRRFPRLAGAGAALVTALRNYLLGGGGPVRL